MRQITSDLNDAQQVRTPRTRVQCTFSARGQNPLMPTITWSEIVANTGQSTYFPMAAVGLPNGNILRFVSNGTAIIQHTITDPTDSDQWTSPTSKSIVTAGISAVSAHYDSTNSRVRVYYIAAGDVFTVNSSDNGDTWSSATTIYSGGDAAADMVSAEILGNVENGDNFIGFSCLNTGVYTARFGYFDSGWVTHEYSLPNWRAGGIDAYAANTSDHRIIMWRAQDTGTSRIRTATKLGASFANEADIDETQAGLFGVQIVGYRMSQLGLLGVSASIMTEGANGGSYYQGVNGYWSYAANYFIDEPIMLPAIRSTNAPIYSMLCSDGTDMYFVGDTVVYRGQPQTASSETLTPIRYTYDDHSLEIEFKPGISTLYVGNIMSLQRTISWGTLTGDESISFYIVSVEEGTDKVVVEAVDAVGYLGISRCRRPHIITGGSSNVAAVMRRIAATVGVEAIRDDSGLSSKSTMPLTIQPNESLLGVSFRAGAIGNFWLVPANDGSFEVTVIDPPNSSISGDYDDTAHAYPIGQQEIYRAANISNYRRLAFAYVLGTQSTDPEDGGAIGMAAGPVVDNTRPLSYSLTNNRYNSTARVSAAATAEGTRQKKLTIDGVIEAWANLALEKYDIVEVTEPLLGWSSKSFRVRRIVERWDKHRLTQTIFLGTED